MFGLGVGELSLVALVLIVVVGPKHLPKLMGNVGKVLRQVRRATDDLKNSIGYEDVMREIDVRKDIYRNPAPQKPKTAQHGAANYRMTAADRENEYPTEGVDRAHQKRVDREAEEQPEPRQPQGEAAPVTKASGSNGERDSDSEGSKGSEDDAS